MGAISRMYSISLNLDLQKNLKVKVQVIMASTMLKLRVYKSNSIPQFPTSRRQGIPRSLGWQVENVQLSKETFSKSKKDK